MDIFILLYVEPGVCRSLGIRSATSGLFQLHFVSIADPCHGPFQGAFDTSAFDGVDYPTKVMFNQTKWNDSLHQKN
ncbi:MAG: hypothetical protein EOR81_09185 [Mesorhizobium sp.]|nr:MAG: hypothetical protein EOR81_09185 [Mesorhizobium sp.]